MGLATGLETRLPATRAALAAGLIDEDRARLIWRPTRHLTDADAAYADEILAALAPGLRYDQLARKAQALAMKLDPEAFQRGKDKERRDRQRVVAGREESGNAFLAARELAIEDALASKAHIDALAVMLRRGGLPGTLQQLRVLAFNDLTQGRDPSDRLPQPADPAASGSHRPGPHAGDQPRGGADPANGSTGGRCDESPPGSQPGRNAGSGGGQEGSHHGTDARDGDDDASWDGCPDMPEWQHERRGTREDQDYDSPGPPPGPPAPFPALINLTIPAGNLFGWSAAPGQAGGWGLTDPGDTRCLIEAASQHPQTRWCVTLLARDGTAVAHGCARGAHPWIPPPDDGRRNRDGPDEQQAAALAGFLRDLNVTFTPIATGTCDHRNAENRYVPSRKLRHLVCARTTTCPAPGCGAQAYHNDLDHTIPHPAGPTDECNLGPPCRRHHRVKQAPGWTLTQPEPGVMTWTTPSGRSHTTRPTVYEQ
jgi:Domain of unknown function (DUF222)